MSTPLAVIRVAIADHFYDSAGRPVDVVLRHGLSEMQLSDLANEVGGALPREIREVLAFCSGFEFPPFGAVWPRSRWRRPLLGACG